MSEPEVGRHVASATGPRLRDAAHPVLLKGPRFGRRGMITYRFLHNLKVDGRGVDKTDYKTPAQYEHAVTRQIDRIHRTATGRAVLHEISRKVSHHGLTIVPYNDHTQDNAYAAPTDSLHATVKGGKLRYAGDAKNSPYDKKAGHNVDDTGKPVLDDKGHAYAGQGGGSDSIITYSPVTWFHYIHNHPAHRSGAQPDEVLFHEMVHAARQMRGIAENKGVKHMYDTEEEFFAIVIANIYASELGLSRDLRADHHGFEHLSANQDTNGEFLPKKNEADYRYRLVEKLVKEEPGMCHRLQHVKAAFNPIRRYFELNGH